MEENDNHVFNIHAIEKQLAIINFANSIFGRPTPEESAPTLSSKLSPTPTSLTNKKKQP